MSDTKKILEYLFKSIVISDGSVDVKEEGSDDLTEAYIVSVPKDEIGRAIGKNGSVIKAIRTLASQTLKSSGKRLNINLNEI